jgi:hypothetical protein
MSLYLMWALLSVTQGAPPIEDHRAAADGLKVEVLALHLADEWSPSGGGKRVDLVKSQPGNEWNIITLEVEDLVSKGRTIVPTAFNMEGHRYDCRSRSIVMMPAYTRGRQVFACEVPKGTRLKTLQLSAVAVSLEGMVAVPEPPHVRREGECTEQFSVSDFWLDANRDRKIDERDLAFLHRRIGACRGQSGYDSRFDWDGDCCYTDKDHQNSREAFERFKEERAKEKQ